MDNYDGYENEISISEDKETTESMTDAPSKASNILGSLADYGILLEAKSTVETQWYKSDPDLLQLEIRIMQDFKQNIKMEAEYGFLQDGRMYWAVQLYPGMSDINKNWALMLVYDSDHPYTAFGGSVRVYPVIPDFKEMQIMVNDSSVTPKKIPWILRDSNDLIYIDTSHLKHQNECLISTATTHLKEMIRWICYFELGLNDQITWSEFVGYLY